MVCIGKEGLKWLDRSTKILVVKKIKKNNKNNKTKQNYILTKNWKFSSFIIKENNVLSTFPSHIQSQVKSTRFVVKCRGAHCVLQRRL